MTTKIGNYEKFNIIVTEAGEFKGIDVKQKSVNEYIENHFKSMEKHRSEYTL